jgi:hypothetical protein
MRTINEIAEELLNLKRAEDEANASLKDIKRQIEDIQKREIPELFEAQGVSSAKVAGVGTIYLQDKVFAYVKADDQDRFKAWLRDNGHGDLIKETVHAATLTAWAKEQLEQAKSLPEFVSASFVTQAALRKS